MGILEEEYQSDWPSEVQSLWIARSMTRLLFGSDYDPCFDQEYELYLAQSTESLLLEFPQ